MRPRLSPRLGQLLAAGVIVGIVAIGATPSSNAAPNVNPGTFSRVSSGVALIHTYGCGGKALGQGTGFLVGSSVVMTARHVIVGACRTRIRVGGETFFTKRNVSWYGGGASLSAADVATLKLDHASDGFVFRVRSSRVPVGTNLGMVGYPLGNRLSLNQGKMIWRGKQNRAPLMAVRMLGAEGASGSPFIDDEGRVVGILQIGLGSKDVFGQRTAGVLMGLDLVRWWGPRARLDLCRAYPNGGIAGCPGSAPPQLPDPEIFTDVSAHKDDCIGPQGYFQAVPDPTIYFCATFEPALRANRQMSVTLFDPTGAQFGTRTVAARAGSTGASIAWVLPNPRPGWWQVQFDLSNGASNQTSFHVGD